MTVRPGPGVIVWLANQLAEARGDPTLRELVEELLDDAPRRSPGATGRRRRTRSVKPLRPKKKRRVSKYQKEFGRQLKKLKKKHPRTPVTKLMKRAHAATKRAMK